MHDPCQYASDEQYFLFLIHFFSWKVRSFFSHYTLHTLLFWMICLKLNEKKWFTFKNLLTFSINLFAWRKFSSWFLFLAEFCCLIVIPATLMNGNLKTVISIKMHFHIFDCTIFLRLLLIWWLRFNAGFSCKTKTFLGKMDKFLLFTHLNKTLCEKFPCEIVCSSFHFFLHFLDERFHFIELFKREYYLHLLWYYQLFIANTNKMFILFICFIEFLSSMGDT